MSASALRLKLLQSDILSKTTVQQHLKGEGINSFLNLRDHLTSGLTSGDLRAKDHLFQAQVPSEPLHSNPCNQHSYDYKLGFLVS